MSKLSRAGVTEIVYYNGPCPWQKTGVMEPDGLGGKVDPTERKKPDEEYPTRQWWPECLNVAQIKDVADRAIPDSLSITLDPTLSDLEAFIRAEGITVIIAHSQGGHAAGLLIRRMEEAGDCPITHVVLMSTFNSRWPGDCLQTPALVIHFEDDDVVDFEDRPTVPDCGKSEWLWDNGIEHTEPTGGHSTSQRGRVWTEIANFLAPDA